MAACTACSRGAIHSSRTGRSSTPGRRTRCSPSEEFVRILAVTTTDGYHDPARGKVLAPEYGENDETAGRCADVKEPLTVLPAH